MRVGRLVLAIFIVLQLADGLITYGAVRIYGAGAEGNPLLVTWIHLAGPAATLIGAKCIACTGAVILYLAGRQRVLATLTAFYLCGVVVPWLALLAMGQP